MSNLANTLGDQGHLEEAAKMYKEVLEKRRRILGDEHPSTISAMSNLANTLGDQGHLEEAAKMYKEALEKARRTLGEDHPTTKLVTHNLAIVVRPQTLAPKVIEPSSRKRTKFLKALRFRSRRN
jgi:tetratricopeptide (TPR) repeat protein